MRLDAYLFEKGLYTSRTKATQAVEKGQVAVNGKVQKPSYNVRAGDAVEVLENQKFVSLGGYKLEKALNDFDFSPKGLTFLDVGASTGGFTDCLLQRGAKKVYDLDVGESLLDPTIADDDRVVAIENFNARNIDENTLDEKVDCAVIDCSFISLKLVIDAVFKAVKDDGVVIALIKPQFECGRGQIGKSGIVLSGETRLDVCTDVISFCETRGFFVNAFTSAPLQSNKNVEYLVMLSRKNVKFEKTKIYEIVYKNVCKGGKL